MIKNQIFNEDCIVGMQKIPDGAVDMCLTDLPFGTTDCAWDLKIPMAAFWKEINRVTKENAAIVLFAQMPFGAELILSNPAMFRYEMIWVKTTAAGFLNAHKMPLRYHENILVFYRKLPTYNPQYWYSVPYKRKRHHNKLNVYGRTRELSETDSKDGRRFPSDVLYFDSIMNNAEARYHPTQKPLALLEYLIQTYTDKKELVLDATMGSGSTCVAAVNTGRNFVGFETDEKFFSIAQKRIEIAQAQQLLDLF